MIAPSSLSSPSAHPTRLGEKIYKKLHFFLARFAPAVCNVLHTIHDSVAKRAFFSKNRYNYFLICLYLQRCATACGTFRQ